VDYFINHEIRITIKQPVILSSKAGYFFVAHVCFFVVTTLVRLQQFSVLRAQDVNLVLHYQD